VKSQTHIQLALSLQTVAWVVLEVTAEMVELGLQILVVTVLQEQTVEQAVQHLVVE
jgi:hypothetical protein